MRLAGACSQRPISIDFWCFFRKVHLGAKNTIKLIDKMSLGADALKVEGLIEKKGSIALEVTMATNTV